MVVDCFFFLMFKCFLIIFASKVSKRHSISGLGERFVHIWIEMMRYFLH